MNLSHPLARGVLATFLVVLVSLGLCVSLTPEQLLGWGTLIPVAMVPAQIVISLFWGCQYPRRIAMLPQPLAGLGFLGLTVIAGGMVAVLAFRTVGGGITPPTPFVNMFLILSVPVTLWLVVVLQAWPFRLLSKNPGVVGGALWLGAYALAYGLFRSLFNFGFLKGAPIYFAELDPQGAMMALVPLVFSIASVMVMLSLVLLDFWPLSLLVKRIPALGNQPWFALLAGALIIVIARLVWSGFVDGQQMDLVVFLVQVCVSVVFGLFILLVMMEGVPFLSLPQPWRGLILVVVALLLGLAVFPLYRAVALHFYPLPAGQPGYVLELWIASAMLAITFPLMVVLGGYFKFWPLPAGAK